MINIEIRYPDKKKNMPLDNFPESFNFKISFWTKDDH